MIYKMSINTKIIEDVDSLFSLLNTEIISLLGMNPIERKHTLDQFLDSTDSKQLEDVCQGLLVDDFIKLILLDQNISHIILLRMKKLVIAYAFLTEKETLNGIPYLYIDIICSRKYTSTGKQILLASENLALRRGITFTSLSSVFEAIGFYEKMDYKTIPINEACSQPNSGNIPDALILNISKEAKFFLDSTGYSQGNRKIPNETFNLNITRILSNLRFTQDQISYLMENFGSSYSIWEQSTRHIDLNDYFDDGLLLMTKCLINSKTIGIFNMGL